VVRRSDEGEAQRRRWTFYEAINLSSRQQAPVCLKAIELHGEELKSGAIITAEQNRLRIRTVDNREE